MQERHWFTRSAALVLALVLLAGCGTEAVQPSATPNATRDAGGGGGVPTNAVPPTGPTPDENYLPQIDACKLLSQADVEDVLGPLNYDPQPDSVAPFRRRCIYAAIGSTKGTNGFTHLEVTLTQATASSWQQSKDLFTPRVVSVAGVGDEAYADFYGDDIQLVTLVRGKALVKILMLPADLEGGKKLANKVIENLP